MFLIALTGVWMTIASGYGFFQTTWLGAKLVLMLFVLATIPFLVRPFRQLQNEISSLPNNATKFDRRGVVALLKGRIVVAGRAVGWG